MSVQPTPDEVQYRQCKHCRNSKPLVAFKRDARHRWGGYYFTCKDCHNRRTRELVERRGGVRRPSPSVGGVHEKKRKLPEYDELKRLFLDEQMSLTAIAERFGATKRGVEKALRDRAMRRGEWPLLSASDIARRGALRSPGLRVRGDIIRDLLRQYMAERDLTIRQMAAQSGLPWTMIRTARSKEADTMTVEMAQKVLTAIGEPVPAWIKVAARW